MIAETICFPRGKDELETVFHVGSVGTTDKAQCGTYVVPHAFGLRDKPSDDGRIPLIALRAIFGSAELGVDDWRNNFAVNHVSIHDRIK